jgi:hypothetical protein
MTKWCVERHSVRRPIWETAQELDARTLLLQSQLDYTEANDEIIYALGRTPE